MCNLLKEIESIQGRELNVKWNIRGNIAMFDWALELARHIREGDETKNPNVKRITEIIASIAGDFGLRVLHKSPIDESWRG